MREIILWLLIAGSIPVVWRRPLIGLIIYLGANIIRPEMIFWGGSTGGQFFIIYYGLIIISSFAKGYFSRLSEILRKEFFLMISMLSAIFISIVMAQFQIDRDYYYAFEIMKTFGICAFIYMLVEDFADVQLIQTVLLSCFGFLGLWGIEQQFRGNERLEGLGGNSWGDSNGVAAVFILFLPVALAKAFTSDNRRDRWISFGVAAIMVTLVICTKSRGGLLGLLTCLFSYGVYTRKTARVIKIALVMAILVSPFATESYLERMQTMKSSDSEDLEGSARSRLILWQAGLMVFADNPLVGTGFLTYPEAKMKYEDKFLYLETEFREYVFRTEGKKVTHNTYIQMLSDCGIAGALPFFILILGGALTGLKARGLLLKYPGNKQIIWLCGFCAGMTGFGVSIVFIDMITTSFIFVQLVFIGILSRMTSKMDFNGQLFAVVEEHI